MTSSTELVLQKPHHEVHLNSVVADRRRFGLVQNYLAKKILDTSPIEYIYNVFNNNFYHRNLGRRLDCLEYFFGYNIFVLYSVLWCSGVNAGIYYG